MKKLKKFKFWNLVMFISIRDVFSYLIPIHFSMSIIGKIIQHLKKLQTSWGD